MCVKYAKNTTNQDVANFHCDYGFSCGRIISVTVFNEKDNFVLTLENMCNTSIPHLIYQLHDKFNAAYNPAEGTFTFLRTIRYPLLGKSLMSSIHASWILAH